jgi:Helicase HerA, central domain
MGHRRGKKIVDTRQFFDQAQYDTHPLRMLRDFLAREEKLEAAQKYDEMRFVGYVLEISYEQVVVITCDPFKRAVGGVPRGSFLIMAPDKLDGLAPHFTLLRVTGTAPTPLSKEVQQTYFELHKRSMPELDIWTSGELQWGALACTVLGMYYPQPGVMNKVAFSGDVNNVVSGHRYRVYSPTPELLDLIVNATVRDASRFAIGKLRLTECQLPFAEQEQPDVNVQVSTLDFRGYRCAMFGKTRLGKSNVVKIIAQSLLETTKNDKSVGQLIFDVDGEYANDNPQDDDKSIRSLYEDRCQVYALTERPSTPSRPLRLNFYEQPASCIRILGSLLEADNRTAQYIRSFVAVSLPDIDSLAGLEEGPRKRAIRKILIYWGILQRAGFRADEARLKDLKVRVGSKGGFDPGFAESLRKKAYDGVPPASIATLEVLVRELETIVGYGRENPDDLKSTGSGANLFDADDWGLLNFLFPTIGGGPQVLRPYMTFHDPKAGAFVEEILDFLDAGKTVILDLGNASDTIRQYFSDMLSLAVFAHQEKKFTSNKLGNHYIQLYFEEAHNLFPRERTDITGVYSRFAKEGAKFHIGMVYSTQSPSTVSADLLAQTENFFIAHMSSQDEVRALAKLQVAFEGLQEDILRTRTPGYMRMLTFSHRFVVPVQVRRFGTTSS